MPVSMVARQGNDILVVTDLEKVLFEDAVNGAASHSEASVSTGRNNHPFCFTTAWKHPATLTDTIFSLPSSFGLSLKSLNGVTENICTLKIITGPLRKGF